MTHRLYIDEVGHAGLGGKGFANERYLCLMGMILDREYVRSHVVPSVEALKHEFFPLHHPDKPVVLHRKELVNRNHPFEALRDPEVRARFDEKLIRLLEGLQCALILVAIDKHSHVRRYGNPAHPYHYCMDAMVERFVGWLSHRRTTGDVIAECRGGREDAELRAAFASTLASGTGYRRGGSMRRALDCHEIRLASKKENVAALQLVDLIAHPCFRRALARRLNEPVPGGFAGRVTNAVAPKFRASSAGQVAGYGVKWLP